MTPASRALSAVSAVEALEADLTQRVLNAEFPPGARLRELELVDEYGVGRHTLRAAFDALVRRGLLERARNRGVSVPVLSGPDLAEVYEVRAALEVEAARTLAVRHIVPDAVREALERLAALPDDAEWRLLVEADFAFHRAIVAGTGNRRLERAHEELKAEILLGLVQLGHGYASVRILADEHHELVRALETGQPTLAERAIRDHLGRAAAWFVAGQPTS